MKRGELQHGGRVTFLADHVVMALKQQRAILVGGGRARGTGIICKTCKEMNIGTQESYMRKDGSLCTSPVLKCGV